MQSLLREVGFPSGSFETMHAFMEARIGRSIRIEHRAARASSICGLWVGARAGGADVIFADMEWPSWRQTVAHEWGHMLCRHDTDAVSAEVLRSLAPLLPESAIQFALSRDSFTSPQEQEAEAVGDEISLRLLAVESRAAQAASLGGFGRVL